MSSLSEFWGPPLALLWSFSNAGHRQISMHVSLVVRCAARWERDVSYGVEQARTGELGMGVPFWTFVTPSWSGSSLCPSLSLLCTCTIAHCCQVDLDHHPLSYFIVAARALAALSSEPNCWSTSFNSTVRHFDTHTCFRTVHSIFRSSRLVSPRAATLTFFKPTLSTPLSS